MSVWTRGWEAQMNLRPGYYRRLGQFVGVVPKVGLPAAGWGVLGLPAAACRAPCLEEPLLHAAVIRPVA